MTHTIDYEFGISAVDSGYIRPFLDAIHLIVEDDRAAIVDTRTNHSATAVLMRVFSKCMRATLF